MHQIDVYKRQLRDRVNASAMGYHAVCLLEQGKYNRIVGMKVIYISGTAIVGSNHQYQKSHTVKIKNKG